MNQEKHHDIVYVNESQVGQEVMDNHFYDLTELPDGSTKWKKQRVDQPQPSYQFQCFYSQLHQTLNASILF